MAQDETKSIREIETALQDSNEIPASKVKRWMSSLSLAPRGVLIDLLTNHRHRIEPPLTMEERFDMIEKYYRDCLIQDVQDSDYIPNRHLAGHEFVNWFKALWNDRSVPRDYLVRLKTMLRDLSQQGQIPKDEVTTAVLEHLFEAREIQEFFSDWKSDPLLAREFALAKEWGDDHLA